MKRNIHGIFLLNKPLGISSNRALQIVKRLLHAAKAGHTGSLDPLATGMLPICLGEATKYSQHLLDADKCYTVTAKLGVRTDTGDAEGAVIRCCEDVAPLSLLSPPELAALLQPFTGEIQQIPPMYSALKHRGQCLYEYARRGESIERPARTVTIHQLEPMGITADTISLRVQCSKGTYIRSLIDDLGERLGCGAHVVRLHREWVQPFQTARMLDIATLEQSVERDVALLPVDAALLAWPLYRLTAPQTKSLQQGLPLFLENLAPGYLRLYDQHNNFLGIGNIDNSGEVVNKRLMSTHFLPAEHVHIT